MPRTTVRFLILGTVLLTMSAVSAHSSTYSVDATRGADSAAGTIAAPFASISKAAAVARLPGDQVLVMPGLYPGVITITGSGTIVAPISLICQKPGACVITGNLTYAGWVNDDARGRGLNPYVTVRGFTFTGGSAYFQLRASKGWVIEANSFGGCGHNGINARDDEIQILRNTFAHLIGHAMTLYFGRNIQVVGNTWHDINGAGLYPPSNSAVFKAGQTDGLLVDSNRAYQNRGPGIWLDGGNTNYTIRRNHVTGSYGLKASWEGPGIWSEINPGPGRITENTVQDNAGAQIGILESPHVTVTKNRLRGGYACLEFRNMDRGNAADGTALKIYDESVTGNTLENCGPVGGKGGAIHTSIGTWTNPLPFHMLIKGNTYKQQPQQAWVDWLGRLTYDKSTTCQALGFECP